MGNYEETQKQETDLGFYTLLSFLNCCCFGNIIGFVLCLYCRHKIKRHSESGNAEKISLWAKRFWLCMVLTMLGTAIITIVQWATTGTLSFLSSLM